MRCQKLWLPAASAAAGVPFFLALTTMETLMGMTESEKSTALARSAV